MKNLVLQRADRQNNAMAPASVLVSYAYLPLMLWSPLAGVHAFSPLWPTNSNGPSATFLRSESTDDADSFDSALNSLQSRIEDQRKSSLVEAIMNLEAGDGLSTVHLVGQASLPTTSDKKETMTCAVLSDSPLEETPSRTWFRTGPSQCLLVPLRSTAQLKLLEFAVHKKELSKSLMLQLNQPLINRDDSLFDNIPWSSWTIDPDMRNRDAANNPIADKFHLGKRDAYNRFMGKDWQGKSVSIGNMALRLKYLIESMEDEDTEVEDDTHTSLAKRILDIQIRGKEMNVAELDYQVAVARQNDPSSLDDLELERQTRLDDLEWTRSKLDDLLNLQDVEDSRPAIVSWMTSFMDEIADWTTDYGKNAAPYRGAIGYAPKLDSKSDIDQSYTTYTSPYALMKEILQEQLNAEVIGAVLENTSLLQGTSAVGGALILRRQTPKKTVSVAGEKIEVNDDEEEYGNQGLKGGETYLVECDCDEAVGMALACGIPIRVESTIWQRASIMAGRLDPQSPSGQRAESVRETLPLWKPSDPELSILVEGQAGNRSSTERVSPLRVPRTTSSLFDTMFNSPSESRSSDLFPTENPVQSLTQYDEMTNEDKARTLMTMSNFEGKLPRPRILRRSDAEPGKPNALDSLLIPLIDESVRRQYLIRDAERQGDTALAEELKRDKSRRQVAKEKADNARDLGVEDVAEWWEKEADLYGSLRADVTQDEGSYSRFLDRDEWYERTRANQAKKLDKKKFGNLLDGIE